MFGKTATGVWLGEFLPGVDRMDFHPAVLGVVYVRSGNADVLAGFGWRELQPRVDDRAGSLGVGLGDVIDARDLKNEVTLLVLDVRVIDQHLVRSVEGQADVVVAVSLGLHVLHGPGDRLARVYDDQTLGVVEASVWIASGAHMRIRVRQLTGVAGCDLGGGGRQTRRANGGGRDLRAGRGKGQRHSSKCGNVRASDPTPPATRARWALPRKGAAVGSVSYHGGPPLLVPRLWRLRARARSAQVAHALENVEPERSTEGDRERRDSKTGDLEEPPVKVSGARGPT